jgi:EAL domain-containing protein (putative c-di-GMP-specific phosphodiesterase class I)
MVTTAEGVETSDQLDSLRAEGCQEVQGYMFSKPVPNGSVEAVLADVASRYMPNPIKEVPTAASRRKVWS